MLFYCDLMSLVINSSSDRTKFLRKLQETGMKISDIKIVPFEDYLNDWNPFISCICGNEKLRKQLVSQLLSENFSHWWDRVAECKKVFYIYSNSHWKNASFPKKQFLIIAEIGINSVPVIEIHIS